MIGTNSRLTRLRNRLKKLVFARMRATCSMLGTGLIVGRLILPVSAVSILLLGTTPSVTQAAQGCSNPLVPETGKVPLPDLGIGTYQGFEGGLYPDGSSIRPVEHMEAGVQIAEGLAPLGGDGSEDPVGGKLVMVSIGMSNTNMMFAGSANDNIPVAFIARATKDPATNPQLELVNGAQGGAALEEWISSDAPSWDIVDTRLADRGLSPDQVQIAWIKLAAHVPGGEFPDGARLRQEHFEAVARNLVIRYPNIKLAYYSTRTYSVVAIPRKGEPVTYEDGFAVKWMIQRQLDGDSSLNFDPARGEVLAPWLSWGPYLWTDGQNPRSDGYIWQPQDQSCGAHPEPPGVAKNAAQLHAFFKTDPTTVPWFLRSTLEGRPPESVSVSASPASGDAPLTVEFQAEAVDPDGQIVEIVWTFGDGTFSYNQDADPSDPLNIQNNPNPTKTYYMPGSYLAYVTITDSSGNSVHRSVQVVVEGDPLIQTYQSPSQVDAPTRDSGGGEVEASVNVVLTATADQAGEVSLQWQGDVDDPRGLKIERSTPPNDEWVDIAAVRPDVFNYVDKGVSPSTEYSYRLRLSNEDSGVFSNVVSLVTPPEPSGAQEEAVDGSEKDLQDSTDLREQGATLEAPDTPSAVSVDAKVLVALSVLAGAGLAFSGAWIVGRTRRK